MAIVREVKAIISGRIVSIYCRSGSNWLHMSGFVETPSFRDVPWPDDDSVAVSKSLCRQESAKREFKLSSMHTARAIVGSGRLALSKMLCTSFAEGSSREAATGIIFVRWIAGPKNVGSNFQSDPNDSWRSHGLVSDFADSGGVGRFERGTYVRQ